MYRNQIFWPVLVLVLMTLVIYVRLIKVKVRELRAGRVNLERRALHEDAWPDSVLQINNSIRNQFELPVLFYVLCIVLWELHAVHALTLVAAAAFVLSRIAHAYVHLGSNYITHRRRLFTAGWWVLMFMVVLVVWELGRRAAGLGPV
ncbi:MAG: MAPEG family protein [Steroidobacteraceae bacterium]